MAARRLVLVVNPRGGVRRGLAVLEQVRPRFAAAGAELDVHVTQYPGHARELARSLDLSQCDGFCLIGGDGTLHEVVNGLLSRDQPCAVPLGIIPGGTGNSVLAHLACHTVDQAVARILAGATQGLDVARLNGPDGPVYCLNIVGWGTAVDINRTAERWRCIGRSRYTWAALWHIARAHRRRARLVLDDQVSDDEFLLVLACNTCFTGNGMIAAPQADMSDGLLDVLVVRRASRWQLLQLFQRAFDGSHLALPCVEYHQARSLRVETAAPEPLNLDGELKGFTPVALDMLPRAIPVFA